MESKQLGRGRPQTAIHGSAAKYRGGCRCEECKAGQNQRMRAYGAKKRQASGKTPQPCTLCGKPIARYTQSQRPFHKACKDRAPQWLKDGRTEPAPRSEEPGPIAKTPTDLRSDLRAGYEDNDRERFLAALKTRTAVTSTGCWEWQGRMNRGYPEVSMGKQYKQVHRLSLEVSMGAPLGVLAAHHACANSKCVNPKHLQPITHRENVAEMMARTSLEARIAELEAALTEIAPDHPALRRISHLASA